MKSSTAAIALFLMSSFTFIACNDNCCTLGVNKVCEGDDLCAGQGSWEDCQNYLKGLGYSCN